MDIKQLVDQYFDQIIVENTHYITLADSGPDSAYLCLNIPTAMLRDYLKLRGQDRELPDGAEFWRETGLREKLRNSDKYHGQGHEPLVDILDYLSGKVYGEYQRLNSPERIRLRIIEVPEAGRAIL